MPKACSKTGFSLIELLVTTTIIAVLITVVAISFRQLNQTARDTKRKSDIQEMRGILENYRAESGTYPASSNEIGGYEYSDDGTFLENVPPEFNTKIFLDPLYGTEQTVYFYRYKLHDLPGCTYELSASTETGNGQPCPNCGVTSNAVYCVTD